MAEQAPSYRRTRDGEWVVFGPAELVKPGRVTVRKKDGTTKVEQVTRVGGAFDVEGVSCVYGHIAPRSGSRSRTDGSYECDECGDRVYPGSRCWETGWVH